jgi:hypothetical protein
VLVASTTALLLGSSLSVTSATAAGSTTSPPPQVGLFGAQDPTYDGVFRQSLALLAFTADRTIPPAEAVTWLLGQQCADGGFQSFRPRTDAPCLKSDPAKFAGEDTNSTGIAAAALRAVGRRAAADRALAWALARQNADGGFPYYAGGASDANSTAVVLFGSNTAGRTPDSVRKGGTSAARFLHGLQIGCAGASTDDDGGFAFQDYGSGLLDNDAASVQATLALSGSPLPVRPTTVTADVPRATCPAAPDASASASPSPSSSGTPAGPAAATPSPVQLAAGHLARVMSASGGAIPHFDFKAGARVPGSVSPGDTAWAALSLAAAGVGRSQLDVAIRVLARSPMKAASLRVTATSAGSAAARSTDQPGLLAVTALATSAAGGSAKTVHVYVVRIRATMRVAPVVTTTSPTPSTSATPTLAPTGATSLTPVLAAIGGILLLVGAVGVGSTRRRGTHA